MSELSRFEQFLLERLAAKLNSGELNINELLNRDDVRKYGGFSPADVDVLGHVMRKLITSTVDATVKVD